MSDMVDFPYIFKDVFCKELNILPEKVRLAFTNGEQYSYKNDDNINSYSNGEVVTKFDNTVIIKDYTMILFHNNIDDSFKFIFTEKYKNSEITKISLAKFIKFYKAYKQ